MNKSKQEILDQLITEHENETCTCNFEEECFCLAGSYINGCISLEDTLEELE